MDAFDFAEKHPQLIGLIITTLVGLVWHRGKKLSLDDIWDTMEQLGRQALPALAKEGKLYDDAYVSEMFESRIWAGLNKLGVKRSPVIEKMVHEVVIKLHDELAQKLFDSHIGDFIKKQSGTADIMKTLPEPKPVDTTAGSTP